MVKSFLSPVILVALLGAIWCLSANPGQAQKYVYSEPPSLEEGYAYGCKPEETGPGSSPLCGVVLALSGLKLRDKPSFSGKAVAVIPFGATVERTGNPEQYRPLRQRDWEWSSDSISGYWQALTWDGKKGFAFNAYIGDAIYRMTQPAYLLFQNTAGCWNDGYASPAYHYYAVYPNRDSSVWQLKKFKPVFWFNDDGFGGTSIQADPSRSPSLIVALKSPIAEGNLLAEKINVPVTAHSGEMPASTPLPPAVPIPNSMLQLVTVEKQDQSGRYYFQLQVENKQTRRRQVIVSRIYGHTRLIWAGDLDRDGITDFMLSYESHEYGRQLFLSSLAKAGELVWPVQIYWLGDCC